MMQLARHTTPPLATGLVDNQLMTPPDTGRSPKRVRFTLPHDGQKRQYDDEEAALAGYVELDNDDDYGSPITSDSSSGKYTSPATPPTPATAPITSDHKDSQLYALQQLDSFGPAAILAEPFPFMKLPISVRKRVYAHLLVIPAIICVRQKHTSYHEEKKAFLYAEARELLPGIAYALAQFTVDGYKFRYNRFKSASTLILRASREVYDEAKPILYGQNIFEITMPSLEMSPCLDYKIPLFPRGCQPHVRHLVIRFRAFYSAKWLLNSGYVQLKNAYRGLESLTLILESEHSEKGLAKTLLKQDNERWVPYVKRLNKTMAEGIFGGKAGTSKTVKHLPLWIDLRVLFDGERYDEMDVSAQQDTMNSIEGIRNAREEEDAARLSLKRGLAEAFELFKKGGVLPLRPVSNATKQNGQ